MKLPPTRRVRWAEAHRIISARHPPIEIFEGVASAEDFDELLAVEELTNPRIRDAVGDLTRVPKEERVFGEGSSWIMAAFTHGRRPSRFSDGSFGVYYAARHLLTSIKETAFHYARFLRASASPAGEPLDVRVLTSNSVDGRFHTISVARYLDPDSYVASQAMGRELRDAGSNGVVYPSVRHHGGRCLGAFRANAVPAPNTTGFLRYRFDGQAITAWYRLGTDEGWSALSP